MNAHPPPSTRRLMAIDPSLTCSGWALFSLASGELMGIGKIRSMPPSHPLAARLVDLQEKITSILGLSKLSAEDVLVCEAQTTMRDPRAAIKVEQVRSIFEAVARARGVVVPGRINPRTVHNEIMGMRGKQLPRPIIKQAAVQVVSSLFSDALERVGFQPSEANLKKHQDVVDAILLGSLAVTKVRSAALAGISLEEAFDRPALTRRIAS